MSYSSSFALPYSASFDVRVTSLKPAVRAVVEGMKWLGGGVLFAATVYVMVALPGLID